MGNQYFVTEKERQLNFKNSRPIAKWVWLLLFIMPPIGIYFLWKRKGKNGVFIKIVITLLFISWTGIWASLVTWLLRYFVFATERRAYIEYLRALTLYVRNRI